jgi:hypothetical protein
MPSISLAHDDAASQLPDSQITRLPILAITNSGNTGDLAILAILSGEHLHLMSNHES